MAEERQNPEDLVAHDLTLRLDEARDALCAIRSGEVDALVILGKTGPHVLFLEGADPARQILFETLNEGALTMTAGAAILGANRKFAELLGLPSEDLLGALLTRFTVPADAGSLAALMEQ